MNTKEIVLSYLEQSKGEYLSGSELAERIGVSRNAVWKAIRQLEQDGHEIDAQRTRGYRLSQQSGILTRQSIEKHLRSEGISVAVYDELPSTNTVLKQFAEQGAPEGTVILARRQTSGRGRLGRSFFSPADSGIYMSILLRPQIAAKDALLITTCAAVAVAQAIETHTGASCGIKWVNDIFCAGKKVCGILTEASLDLESGGLNYAVLGIGINISPPKDGFPEELKNIAGSIAQIGSPQPEGSRTDRFPEELKQIAGCVSENGAGDLGSRIAAEVIDRFFAEYPHLCEKRFLRKYRDRSILTGKQVNVIKTGAAPQPAEVLGIADDLSLLLRYPDGREEYLATGEVSVRLNEA